MSVGHTKRQQDTGSVHPSLKGLAELMTMAFHGMDLTPLGHELAQRAGNDPSDANALMDLSTIMHLTFNPDVALPLQAQALEISRHYQLPASGQETVRLLAIMAPGELMDNAPLEFLVQGSDICLDMFYLSHDLPVPDVLPEHDVLFIAINESDSSHSLLEQAQQVIQLSNKPVLNLPEFIARLNRPESVDLLKPIAGMVMPETYRIERKVLDELGNGRCGLDAIAGDIEFPIIVRPVGSHAGHGLSKFDDSSAIALYLIMHEEQEFYLSPFIDYSDSDGQYRKYRVVFVGHRPYACHMAISSQWMVHYLNANMDSSADKRTEEAQFMESFDEGFARRHAQALHDIAQRVALDYLIIDCAETSTGELLVFEIDSGAVVHDMDSPELYPYKSPQMRKIFAAFRELVLEAKVRAPANHVLAKDGDDG